MCYEYEIDDEERAEYYALVDGKMQKLTGDCELVELRQDLPQKNE